MTEQPIPGPDGPAGGDWHTVPLAWHTDVDHGGRWWSLTTGMREWLWTNPAPTTALARLEVQPGDDFVDAGGGEECFPHVRGVPDHGDAWSRVWDGARLHAQVDTEAGSLARTVVEGEDGLRVAYALDGGEREWTHAVHLLLDLSETARLVVPAGAGMTVLDHPEPGQEADAVWPTVDGTDLSVLGPDDGTAVCAVLDDLGPDAEAYVVDGDAMLRLRWGGDTETRPGMMLWRNLRGWPDDGPYRSIGVEPLVRGRGAASWWLEVTAYERG